MISVVWLGFTLLRFAVTLVALVGLPLLATFSEGGLHPLWGLASGVGFLGYLLLGYFVRPGPARPSLVTALLLPGYLLAEPVAEVFFWLTGEAGEEDRGRTG